jgi:dihydrofolate reductase
LCRKTLSLKFNQERDYVIRLIAAVDSQMGIANEHGIPWQGKIPTDTRYFQDQTATGVIIMGYETYKEFDKPLHDRVNFVLARPNTVALRTGFDVVFDLAQFFREHTNELVWVIGGAGLFTVSLPQADELFLTQLDGDFHCTKFFPKFADIFYLASEAGPHVENDISFIFQTWRRS